MREYVENIKPGFESIWSSWRSQVLLLLSLRGQQKGNWRRARAEAWGSDASPCGNCLDKWLEKFSSWKDATGECTQYTPSGREFLSHLNSTRAFQRAVGTRATTMTPQQGTPLWLSSSGQCGNWGKGRRSPIVSGHQGNCDSGLAKASFHDFSSGPGLLRSRLQKAPRQAVLTQHLSPNPYGPWGILMTLHGSSTAINYPQQNKALNNIDFHKSRIWQSCLSLLTQDLISFWPTVPQA